MEDDEIEFSSRTFIQDISDQTHLERIRGEILENVEGRRQEALQAFGELVKYLGIILSGGTIAILGFIGSHKDGPVPSSAFLSLLCFVLALLSFAILLYYHYLIHQARWDRYAGVAHRFFVRDASLEDVITAPRGLRFPRFYQWFFFWIPFGLTAAGFLFGAVAAFSLTQTVAKPVSTHQEAPPK